MPGRVRSAVACLLVAGALPIATPWDRRTAARSAPPATLRLIPQDTTLNVDAINYSTDPLITTYTYDHMQVANAVLMTFDLSALPADASVTSATLFLALVDADTSADPTYSVTLHKVINKNPVVARATGMTADGTIPWTPNTCCFNAVPLAQADISPPYDTRAIDKTAGFKSWNATTMLQEWLANPASNRGLLLNSDPSKPRNLFRYFASMENPDVNLRPYLEVIFTAGDATPPVVTMTAPASGSTVSGNTTVTANASDNVRVEAVQFRLDGTPLGAERASAPYSIVWDTTTVADGSHTLDAIARDWAGNTATSSPVTVTVQNGVLVLSPQDTFLNLDSTNYRLDPLLRTYTWPDLKVANAILMKFDLSALPTTAAVSKATLQLSLVESDATSDATYAVSTHKVLRQNDVTKATGMTTNGVTQWTANACCYNSIPLAQADISSAYDTQQIGKTAGPNVWTITALVQEWATDPASNFGLLLNSDKTKLSDRYRNFASMEHTNPALRPSLRVTLGSGDVTRPSVTITAPASGATVSNTVTISATASDNVGVAGVQLRVDGKALGAEITTAPYSRSWNTTTVPDGSHTIDAVARDAAGNTGTSAPVTVTVMNDGSAPAIAGVSAGSITATAATITWTTDEPADSQVEYGQTATYGSLSALDTTRVTAHSVRLTGLAQAKLYHYRVRSRDAAGNLAISPDFTFTTLDGTAPTVSISAPASGSTVSGTVTVTATASDNVGVTGVQFLLDGANLGAEDTTAPYSMSWNTTTAANGSHSISATASDAAGNRRTSAAVTVTVSNGTPPPSSGIAARFPGDVGIENDPDVVLVERFEDTSMSNVFARWTDVLNGSSMSFSSDVPSGSSGSTSLTIPWTGGGSSGGHLYKQLSTGVNDTLYVRYYIKYPSAGRYQHTGVWMGGSNPSTPWPNPQAGTKPVGNDRFIAAAEDNFAMSRFDHYDYWMNMHLSADGNYWGNVLLNNPSVQVSRGQWMCVEQMVKLNNPTTAFNGEHAIWLDGLKISHLGQGFPNGTWNGGIFTQSSSGTPFEGFRWRSDASLNINWLWLQVYAPGEASGVSSNIKFDHVVVAKSYIGCLTDGAPPPPPSPPPPSGGWPNEPTGLTLRSDWGMDQNPPTSGDGVIPGSPNWKVVGNAAPGSSQGWVARVSDAGAPLSASNVFDFVYPQGMIEGDAPATVYYDGLSADEVYVGFWWKPSSPFDFGPNGNKVAFIFNGGGGAGGQQFMILMPDGKLHVLPEYPGDFRWRTPNVNATTVALGAWHRVEWYTNRVTGTMKWWLDGVLEGSYTDVRNSVRFDMFQFSPTWGGNIGARKQQTDHYWFDHVHLSTR